MFPDLRNLMAKVYGPPAIIAEEFARVGRTLTLFGSWTARFAGEPGPPANDIDVLVVGDVNAREVWAAAARASKRLGMDVNPVIRTEDEWAHDTSAFAEEVRRRPVVHIAPSAIPDQPPNVVGEDEVTTRWG